MHIKNEVYIDPAFTPPTSTDLTTGLDMKAALSAAELAGRRAPFSLCQVKAEVKRERKRQLLLASAWWKERQAAQSAKELRMEKA